MNFHKCDQFQIQFLIYGPHSGFCQCRVNTFKHVASQNGALTTLSPTPICLFITRSSSGGRMMNQEIMCEVEIGTHGSMVEIDGDDQVGVKVTLQGAGWNDVTNLSYFLRLDIYLFILISILQSSDVSGPLQIPQK